MANDTNAPKEQSEREAKLAAAKAKAEARKQARLQQHSSDQTAAEPNSKQSEREAKLAAAKAKAEARKQAHLSVQAAPTTNEDVLATDIEPVSTDKDVIKEAERHKVQAQEMADAQSKHRDLETEAMARKQRIEQAKARSQARRRKHK